MRPRARGRRRGGRRRLGRSRNARSPYSRISGTDGRTSWGPKLRSEKKKISREFRWIAFDLRLLQSIRELLAELHDLRRDDGATIARGRILAEVVLVVLLPAVERGERSHLRHDGSPPDPGFLDLPDDLLCHLLLFRGVREDRGAILRALVGSLSVPRGRIVDLQEGPQDVDEGNRLRVEGDLDGLRMTSGVRADGVVGRISQMSARKRTPQLLYLTATI